jgi:hypothetical protein
MWFCLMNVFSVPLVLLFMEIIATLKHVFVLGGFRHPCLNACGSHWQITSFVLRLFRRSHVEQGHLSLWSAGPGFDSHWGTPVFLKMAAFWDVAPRSLVVGVYRRFRGAFASIIQSHDGFINMSDSLVNWVSILRYSRHCGEASSQCCYMLQWRLLERCVSLCRTTSAWTFFLPIQNLVGVLQTWFWIGTWYEFRDFTRVFRENVPDREHLRRLYAHLRGWESLAWENSGANLPTQWRVLDVSRFSIRGESQECNRRV